MVKKAAPKRSATGAASKAGARAAAKATSRKTSAEIDGKRPVAATGDGKRATGSARRAAEVKTTDGSTALGRKATSVGQASTAPPLAGAAKPYAGDAKFLAEQRQMLESERSVYESQASDLRAEADSLAQEREPGDVQFDEESGEGGTVTVDRERDLALSAQALSAVEEIDAALARISAGTYGACERCHQAIPKPRLRALPFARLCVACKSGGLARR